MLSNYSATNKKSVVQLDSSIYLLSHIQSITKSCWCYFIVVCDFMHFSPFPSYDPSPNYYPLLSEFQQLPPNGCLSEFTDHKVIVLKHKSQLDLSLLMAHHWLSLACRKKTTIFLRFYKSLWEQSLSPSLWPSSTRLLKYSHLLSVARTCQVFFFPQSLGLKHYFLTSFKLVLTHLSDLGSNITCSGNLSTPKAMLGYLVFTLWPFWTFPH